MKKIALIGGAGKLPFFLKKRVEEKGESVVTIGIREFPPLGFSPDYWIRLGEMGRLLRILQEEDIKEIILSGKVDKRGILEYKGWDSTAREILLKAPDKRDLSLLFSLYRFFEKQGFSFPPLEEYLSPWLAEEGVLTLRHPTPDEEGDLKLAWEVGKKLSELDVGHTVVVRGGVITAVETFEGTDETIRRGGRWGEGGGVAKVPRPKEDLRWDPPVVGIGTLEVMEEVGIKALVVGAGKTILLEKEEFIKEAESREISVLGWR